MTLAFDLLLALALLWSGWRTLATPRLDRAIVLFIAFGLVMVLTWARLSAPDIGLAEAAIGAGLTGALLLDAYGALRRRSRGAKKRMTIVALAFTLALAFVAFLATAMLELRPSVIDLRPPVAAHLAKSGVSHPVTAVLLNFRGYDTLLEIAVLLLALLAILAVIGNAHAMPIRAAHPVLQMLARLAVPLMIVLAGYLLWAGAFRPGGAFQAGAVLAAAAILLHLTGLLPSWQTPGLRLRMGLAAGFTLFLGVAAALLTQGSLLQYPPQAAGALILLIESGLMVSLALTLAGLFLFLSRQEGA
jgi:multisubunit Na+/H+ antiporter MnhB subunit